MSKRRSPGEIVIKKSGAGFTNEVLHICIPTLEDFKSQGFKLNSVEEHHDQCMMGCGDPDCVEYANVLVVEDGKKTDEWIYHVSECQMEDVK